MEVAESQIRICQRYGAEYSALDVGLKLGISDNFFSGDLPLNGMRHSPEGDTCGWYLWAGEYSDADDFFKPLHVRHLVERGADIIKFFGLPPGWRFLCAPNYEDVWFDPKLLDA